MRRPHFSQQVIVALIFVVMFASFALSLPGFMNGMIRVALLQIVAILGILCLSMALIALGRGIDLSMVATLAVPPGLLLQMIQNGHSVPTACVTALSLALILGLINGWLIAQSDYPEAPVRNGCGPAIKPYIRGTAALQLSVRPLVSA
jgi:ribose transport system permease protein